jgi:hypothetical protein
LHRCLSHVSTRNFMLSMVVNVFLFYYRTKKENIPQEMKGKSLRIGLWLWYMSRRCLSLNKFSKPHNEPSCSALI